MQENRLPHERTIYLPNAATLERLMAHRGEWSVSIYFPTVEAGADTQQNRIHFKNATRQAEEKLREYGADDETIERTLKPVKGWADDEERWAHQGRGKAIFLHDGSIDHFRLPASVEARTLVGDRFHLLPLIQLQSASTDYYVLCLDPKEPKLFHSTTFSMEEIVMDFPSLEDVLGSELTDKRQQGHSSNGQGGNWIPHGQGAGSLEERKKELRKYCRILDAKIRDYLPSGRTPLVIAGVDYVGAIYEESSEHPTIVGRVGGSPGAFDREELHRRAFEAAADTLRSPERQDLRRLEQAQRDASMVTEIDDVLVAASDGRVELLFVADGSLRFGQWDPEKRAVGEAPEKPRSENDLTDLAAREVIGKGGRVRFVEAGSLPVDQPVAAVLRF